MQVRWHGRSRTPAEFSAASVSNAAADSDVDVDGPGVGPSATISSPEKLLIKFSIPDG